MRTLTQALKDLLSEQFREQLDTEVDIYVADTEITKDSMAAYSRNETNLQYYSDDPYQKTSYSDCATFEEDFFTVGSNQRVAPTTTESAPVGYRNVLVGKNIDQTIHVNIPQGIIYTRPYISGITVICEYSATIRVVYGHYPDVTSYAVNNTDRLVIDVDEMSDFYVEVTPVSGRRARIKEVVLGRVLSYNNSSITSCYATQYASALGDSIPYTELQFTILDLEQLYNIDNPSGVYNMLDKGQLVKVRVGKGTEKLDMFALFLNDVPVVRKNTVQFTAKDALNLIDNYYPPLASTGLYIRDYIDQVLLECDLLGISFEPRWFVNSPFMIDNVGLPFNSLLQTYQEPWGAPLLSADLGVISTSFMTSSSIHSEEQSKGVIETYGDPTYVITNKDWKLDTLQADKLPLVRNVKAQANKWSNGVVTNILEASNISISGEVEAAGNEETVTDLFYNPGLFLFTYKQSTPTVTLGDTTGTLHITQYVVYADRLRLYSYGTGTLSSAVVNGMTSSVEVRANNVVRMNKKGSDLDYNNPVCLSFSDGTGLTFTKGSSYYDKNVLYSGEFMQDYRLQCGDFVYFDTPFGEKRIGYVEKLYFDLTSCWGSIQLRRLW